MRSAAWLAILFWLAWAAEAAAQSWSLSSPAGRSEVALRMTAEGGVEYRVLLHRGAAAPRIVVGWSELGLETAFFDSFPMREPVRSDLGRTLDFTGEARTTGRDTYRLVTGKRRDNDAAYAALALSFRDRETGRLLRIDLRAYDEGVAFRYALPEASPVHHRVTAEQTAFNLGTGARHWGQAYDFHTMYHPSYETLYDDLPSGTATPAEAGTGWAFPSLFDLGGAWVLIHESGLDANYQGSHLAPQAPGGIYRIAPPLAEESMGFGANFPTAPLPWTMPWRMIVVGESLADIVESNLVFHLAPPSRIADTSWIRLGPAAWNWASDHGSGLDQARLRPFIDLAAEMGWPYALIDANWNLSGERAVEDLTAYAAARNVGLLFWYNSGGRHNAVTEQPRNIMDDRARRRAEFARLERLGVRGVKVDFLQSDKQDIVRLYLEILEDAAEFHLLANFHGSTIPRGWQRTWPNLISMEAVRGEEFYSFEGDYAARAPRQNTIHPFLRNVVGSMDYTPTSFASLGQTRLTTNAHEAALAVLFESGVQHFPGSVASYRALPPDWRAYLAGLPTAWDETRLLAGTPGDHVVLARRHGRTWYVAGINGRDRPLPLAIDLSRLEGIGPRALILVDGDDGGFGSRRTSLRRDARLRLALRPYGGFVMIVRD
jgi:alpha-glucosidase